jgi:flagellar biosynthesis chaperone FliJ
MKQTVVDRLVQELSKYMEHYDEEETTLYQLRLKGE